MYSRILAMAAGIGPAIAVFTRVTISDSRAGDANAYIATTSLTKLVVLLRGTGQRYR